VQFRDRGNLDLFVLVLTYPYRHVEQFNVIEPGLRIGNRLSEDVLNRATFSATPFWN
jgi:hypothetical protein